MKTMTKNLNHSMEGRLTKRKFAWQLRENKPDLYKQLVNEIFGEEWTSKKIGGLKNG
jgi:hypothetical protein